MVMCQMLLQPGYQHMLNGSINLHWFSARHHILPQLLWLPTQVIALSVVVGADGAPGSYDHETLCPSAWGKSFARCRNQNHFACVCRDGGTTPKSRGGVASVDAFMAHVVFDQDSDTSTSSVTQGVWILLASIGIWLQSFWQSIYTWGNRVVRPYRLD